MIPPVLNGQNISVRYGTGCARCFELTGAEAGTNICPACHSVVALNQVGLEISPGAILGIIGESGSGKSTLMRIASGLERPLTGTMHFRGADQEVDIVQLDAAQRRRLRDLRFGIVYQSALQGLNFQFSAGGNIAERILNGGIRNYGAIRAKASDLLSKTRVPHERMDESPKDFSGGMQQRVQISKALAIDPAILFLDEVTTGLDLSVQARILDLLLELHRRLNTTMVYVTHDQEDALVLGTRIALLNGGRLEQIGTPGEIYSHPNSVFAARFLGDSNLLPATLTSAEGAALTAILDAAPSAQIAVGGLGSGSSPGQGFLAVRPEAIAVGARAASNVDAVTLSARVITKSFRGAHYNVTLGLGSDTLVRSTIPSDEEANSMTVGSAVTISWPVHRGIFLSR
jgi:putative phosphonate transport system ATP-binding protein